MCGQTWSDCSVRWWCGEFGTEPYPRGLKSGEVGSIEWRGKRVEAARDRDRVSVRGRGQSRQNWVSKR